jgi:PAS domain S-box-containing protein
MNLALNTLGTFDVNHQTGTRHWSDRMKQLFGLDPRAEFDFSTLFRAIYPADRRAFVTAIAASLRPDGPEHFAIEHRVRWPDGSVRWIYSIAHTMRSDEPDHRPLCTIGLATDITREKEAERLDELTCA